jgi:hypothetical protein
VGQVVEAARCIASIKGGRFSKEYSDTFTEVVKKGISEMRPKRWPCLTCGKVVEKVMPWARTDAMSRKYGFEFSTFEDTSIFRMNTRDLYCQQPTQKAMTYDSLCPDAVYYAPARFHECDLCLAKTETRKALSKVKRARANYEGAKKGGLRSYALLSLEVTLRESVKKLSERQAEKDHLQAAFKTATETQKIRRRNYRACLRRHRQKQTLA